MPLDWEEIKYQWNDLRYRPEVKRRVLTGAAVGLIVFVIGAFVISVLTSGREEPPKAAMVAPGPPGAPAPAPAYRGAKEFAEELQSDLSADPRFAGVGVVPTVAGREGDSGRVVLMGQLPDTDLAALKSLVAAKNPPVRVIWRVTRP